MNYCKYNNSIKEVPAMTNIKVKLTYEEQRILSASFFVTVYM